MCKIWTASFNPLWSFYEKVRAISSSAMPSSMCQIFILCMRTCWLGVHRNLWMWNHQPLFLHIKHWTTDTGKTIHSSNLTFCFVLKSYRNGPGSGLLSGTSRMILCLPVCLVQRVRILCLHFIHSHAHTHRCRNSCSDLHVYIRYVTRQINWKRDTNTFILDEKVCLHAYIQHHITLTQVSLHHMTACCDTT